MIKAGKDTAARLQDDTPPVLSIKALDRRGRAWQVVWEHPHYTHTAVIFDRRYLPEEA